MSLSALAGAASRQHGGRSSLIEYDPLSGKFYAKEHLSRKVRAGDELGSLKPNGYVRITVQGVSLYAHQWAFLCMGLPIPEQVDHGDRCRSNNRWANLCPSNPSHNQLNKGLQSNNSTGVKGVHPHRGKYRARYCNKELGVFPTVELAEAAYKEAACRS